MAGRYLLIEFDDAAQADALRAKIDAASKAGKEYRAVGLFAKPGPTFCGCGNWESARGKPSVTQRIGRKFGWVVCTQCKLPVPSLQFLFNLIKPRDIINPPKADILKKKLGFYTYGLSAQSLANFDKE